MPRGSVRLTLLHCANCLREKAHRIDRIDGVLAYTCSRCGTTVTMPVRRAS